MSEQEIYKAVRTGNVERMVRTGDLEKRSQENSQTITNTAHAQKIIIAAQSKPDGKGNKQ